MKYIVRVRERGQHRWTFVVLPDGDTSEDVDQALVFSNRYAAEEGALFVRRRYAYETKVCKVENP